MINSYILIIIIIYWLNFTVGQYCLVYIQLSVNKFNYDNIIYVCNSFWASIIIWLYKIKITTIEECRYYIILSFIRVKGLLLCARNITMDRKWIPEAHLSGPHYCHSLTAFVSQALVKTHERELWTAFKNRETDLSLS